jgi:hypothetical protein
MKLASAVGNSLLVDPEHLVPTYLMRSRKYQTIRTRLNSEVVPEGVETKGLKTSFCQSWWLQKYPM